MNPDQKPKIGYPDLLCCVFRPS